MEITKHLSDESFVLLDILSQHLKGGTAKLIEKDGQIQVNYLNSENQKFDVSQCGKIVAPKSNPKEVIESCLAVLDLIKEKRAPDGVLLDRTKISCSRKGTYKNGEDYDVLDKILGKGLNGQIVVVRDKKLGSEHALKTVMLAYFDSNEIRCWTDLEGYNNFPSLYMFNKQNGQIEFHYEILDKAVTISDIIDNHMLKMRENHELLRHFSLYVLQGLLEASSVMHSKNWLHDDLHENNAMLQAKPSSELKVRVLDFGRAKKLDKKATITNDIHQIIRVFTSVYVTEKFQNATDLQKNWEVKLQEQAKELQLSKENKDELLNLIKIALDVHLTEQEIELKEMVDCKLKDSLVENPDIMKEICKLIFPDYSLETDNVDAGSSDFISFNIFKIG